MNIAIDCRYIGMSGIGKVCEGILNELDYDANKYYLIGKKEKLKKYEKAVIVEDETKPYSVKGLFSFDKQLNKICDKMIVPNFLIPFGIKIPVYTVMHDLAFLDVKVTTKNFVDKMIKKILLKRCMKKSKEIAVVSNFTKNRCDYYYKKYSNKCYVNYVGLCQEILNFDDKQLFKENKICFVGNVKPHKGIKTLIEAFEKLPEKKFKLKIIGEKENFLNGLDTSFVSNKNVEFTGKISNEELYREIKTSKFLVLPSIYEGFGIPPLEALFLGTKPIISDIEVFKEVYGGFDVQFFNMNDSQDLKDKILNTSFEVKTKKEEIIKKYNYKSFVNNLLEKINKGTTIWKMW